MASGFYENLLDALNEYKYKSIALLRIEDFENENISFIKHLVEKTSKEQLDVNEKQALYS